MADQELVNKLKGWKENPPNPEDVDEKFGVEFLTTLFTLFQQLSLEDEDLKDEVEDNDLTMQFIMKSDVKDSKFWISTSDEKISFGLGEGSDVTVTMIASAENMFKILSGNMESTSAYISGDLTIEGSLQDAMAFGEIASIAAELIEEAIS